MWVRGGEFDIRDLAEVFRRDRIFELFPVSSLARHSCGLGHRDQLNSLIRGHEGAAKP